MGSENMGNGGWLRRGGPSPKPGFFCAGLMGGRWPVSHFPVICAALLAGVTFPAQAHAQQFADQADRITRAFSSQGNFLGFTLVLIGGLALNLTPCVYPLIGVTVAYFGNEGGGRRRLIGRALCYVLGIALSFSAVGVIAALSGGLFGAALQNPLVLAVIAAMLLALAASNFGLFSLQPPQWMLRRVGTARPGGAGALVMGLGMGLVAAPCIGPIVLGLLLMVQRSGSAIFGFALFFTLAVGMGLPYVGLALAAGNIRRLPRSGEWLAWVEQLFGFLLIGLALYFLDPIVPNRLITRLLPYYAVAVGIYLGLVARAGRSWRPFMLVRTAVAISAGIALIYLLLPSNRAGAPLVFEPFSASVLQRARSAGKPIIIDFSADWCVPCREMEHSTFTDAAVVKAAAGFVRMRADMTIDNRANQALMKQFRVQGVPTTLFLDRAGHIRERRIGYIGAPEFVKLLHGTD